MIHENLTFKKHSGAGDFLDHIAVGELFAVIFRVPLLGVVVVANDCGLVTLGDLADQVDPDVPAEGNPAPLDTPAPASTA